MKLPKMDDPVDRLNRATHLEALKLADDPGLLDWGCMNLAARWSGSATTPSTSPNRSVLITGEFREFTDASHEVPTAERSVSDAGGEDPRGRRRFSLADTVRYNLEREGYAVVAATTVARR